MLRWIAVLFVVLNVIYFAVNFDADKFVEAARRDDSGLSTPALVMLGEQQPANAVSANSSAAKKNAADELPKNELPENSVPVELAAATQSISNGSIADSNSRSAPAATFPVPDIPAEGDAKTSSDNQANSGVDKNSSVAVPVAAESCWEIGKFDDEAQGKALAVRLATAGQTMALQKKAVQGEPDYWVFLGPYANRRQALASHRDLQARKIDSFLINEGELENAVSLGLFSKRSGAESMQQQRKKQGLDARLRAVPRLRNELWGKLKYPAEELPEEIRQIILTQKTDSSLEIKTLDCESIANTEKLD